jgi:hypothetical protein
MEDFFIFNNNCITKSKELVDNLNKTFVFSKIEDNMKIYLHNCYKKKDGILIRKINNYFKNNHKNSKLVSNIKDANVIVLEKRLHYINYDKCIELTPDNIIVNYDSTYRYNNKVINIGPLNKIESVFEVSINNEMHYIIKEYMVNNNVSGNENKIYCDLVMSNKFKFITVDELINISRQQFIKDSDIIKTEMNHEKIKVLLSTRDGVELFHNAMKGKNLTSYINSIIEAFYSTRDYMIQDCITNKIFRNYEISKVLKRYNGRYGNQKHYYTKVMKDMNYEINYEFLNS